MRKTVSMARVSDAFAIFMGVGVIEIMWGAYHAQIEANDANPIRDVAEGDECTVFHHVGVLTDRVVPHCQLLSRKRVWPCCTTLVELLL